MTKMGDAFWILPCFLPILLFLNIFSNAQSVIPEGCREKITTKHVNIYCPHLNLSSVPQGLPRSTTALDLSSNRITALHNDTFRNLTDLVSLKLRSNQVQRIAVDAFKPLNDLAVLDLSYNQLHRLATDLFVNNNKLSVLVLSWNHLTTEPNASIPTLPKLSKVLLDNNAIKSANFTIFGEAKHLSEIKLDNNKITSLTAEDFKPLEGLKLVVMSLSGNGLTSLPPHIFHYLHTVKYLLLKGNRFRELEMVSFNSDMDVTHLDLEGSRVYNIIPLNSSHRTLNRSLARIETMKLSENIIHRIPHYAFWGFIGTKFLDLTKNKITTFSIVSFCGLEDLVEIRLAENHIAHLQKGMFLCNKRLQKITISHNEITLFSPDAFDGLTSLQYLSMSRNFIRRVKANSSWKTVSLTLLDLSFNKLREIGNELLSGLNALKLLNLSFNDISILGAEPFKHSVQLIHLYLVKERTLPMNGALSRMTKLQTLDVSSTIIRIDSMKQFTNASSLTSLKVRACNLRSTDLYDNKTASHLFAGLSSLAYLDLRDNNLDNLNHQVFTPLTSLVSLDLSSSEIIQIPPGLFTTLHRLRTLFVRDNKIKVTFGSMFQGLNNLHSVFLENNQIVLIAPELFNDTPKLTHLMLQGNKISSVKPGTLFPTTESFEMDISQNPFSCTCDLAWFRKWLHATNAVLLHPNKTLCALTSIKDLTNQPIMSFHPEDYCGVKISLISGLTVLGITMVCCCVLAIHKRWWLNHQFFLLRLAICGYEEVEENVGDDHYESQLNVMFLEADEAWVNDIMRPALRDRFPHLERIIYGDEDLQLGMFLINAIYHAIETSYKTVVLISNRSVDDPWFMMKLRMALEHVNDTRLDKIILMFIEDVADNNLPYLARLFLSRNKPYMLWTDDEDGQELFWAQFDKSMRSNRAINNAIPV